MAVKTDRRNDGNTEPAAIKYHSGFSGNITFWSINGLFFARVKYFPVIFLCNKYMSNV